MKKLILEHKINSKEYKKDVEFDYFILNKPEKKLVDLYIVEGVFEELLDFAIEAEVDIFADNFMGVSTELVSLDKIKQKYYMSYAFENVDGLLCPSIAEYDFKKLVLLWQQLMKQKPNYIILSQSDKNQFTLEGKDELSTKELLLIVP